MLILLEANVIMELQAEMATYEEYQRNVENARLFVEAIRYIALGAYFLYVGFNILKTLSQPNQ